MPSRGKTSARHFSGQDVWKKTRRFTWCPVTTGMQMGSSMICIRSKATEKSLQPSSLVLFKWTKYSLWWILKSPPIWKLAKEDIISCEIFSQTLRVHHPEGPWHFKNKESDSNVTLLKKMNCILCNYYTAIWSYLFHWNIECYVVVERMSVSQFNFRLSFDAMAKYLHDPPFLKYFSFLLTRQDNFEKPSCDLLIKRHFRISRDDSFYFCKFWRFLVTNFELTFYYDYLN